MSNDRYQSPLSERYASKEMQYIFSPDKKFKTWRKLWIALAETEKELGLDITQEQIDELKAHADDINYEVAKEREKQVRHDVMSHVYAYGKTMSKSKGNYPSGSHILLCRRQHRYHHHDRSAEISAEKTSERYERTFQVRHEIQRSADFGIYTFPAGTADNRREESFLMADGSCI